MLIAVGLLLVAISAYAIASAIHTSLAPNPLEVAKRFVEECNKSGGLVAVGEAPKLELKCERP